MRTILLKLKLTSQIDYFAVGPLLTIMIHSLVYMCRHFLLHTGYFGVKNCLHLCLPFFVFYVLLLSLRADVVSVSLVSLASVLYVHLFLTGVTPVYCSLFGLYREDEGVWLSPNHVLHLHETANESLLFRIR